MYSKSTSGFDGSICCYTLHLQMFFSTWRHGNQKNMLTSEIMKVFFLIFLFFKDAVLEMSPKLLQRSSLCLSDLYLIDESVLKKKRIFFLTSASEVIKSNWSSLTRLVPFIV